MEHGVLRARVAAVIAGLGLLATAAPAAPASEPSWSCSAGTGWTAAGAQRAEAPSIGGNPCPRAGADAGGGQADGAGGLSAGGSLATDGGGTAQTVDTRRPTASIRARSLAIHNPDGRLVLTASNLEASATAACADGSPRFTSGGTPGTVTLNGRTIDTSREYSEPGVGVNGAPLFGRITIRFDEVADGKTGLTRRAIHLLVTDQRGAVVFEAVAGEVGVGAGGAVCDPPPVCPPGQEPRAGRCVDLTVTPLPDPTQPGSSLPPPAKTGQPAPPSEQPRRRAGCAAADSLARQVSTRRLRHATLCLLNAERARRRLPRLRASAELRRAAMRHARDMLRRGYFSHTEPDGTGIVDRILRSGYLRRFGRWRVGENLGSGWGSRATPRAIVAAWMRSRPHRRNILSRRFRDVGVAVATGAPGGRHASAITYVIDFGGSG